MHRVMIHKWSRNVGDAIQTYALCRWLRRYAGIFRPDLATATPGPTMVLNGYLIGRANTPDAVLAGVFLEPNQWLNATAKWVASTTHGPVGARCPSTQDRLVRRGISSEEVGCATLTLPRHAGDRFGRVAVDVEGEEGCVTHLIPHDATWAEQWSLAIDLLDCYRRAEMVVTNRLHCALPCLAFGTPVKFVKQGAICHAADRLSLWSGLGLPFGEVVEDVDCERWMVRYVKYLAERVGSNLATPTAGHPVRPDPA